MTNNRSTPTRQVLPSAQVAFDGGCLGILFVLIVSVGAVFAIAAFDTEFVASLADRETRKNVFAAIAPLRAGNVNFGALVLAVYSGWHAISFARRFLARRAVWIDDDMMKFHPTVRSHSLPLAMLDNITHKADYAASTLWLQPRDGRRFKVPMVDHDAAEAFVAEVERAKAALTFD